MTHDLGFHHRFLPGMDARTLLLLHGTGGDENDLIGLGQSVAPGWALLSPRGKILENGMPRFFRRLAEGVFDIDDLKARAGELADFILAASVHYGLDREGVVALGYSNGANIASATMFLRPEALAGAALIRPMTPFEPDARASLAGKPVLLLSGQFDPIAPPSHGVHLEKLMSERGAMVARLSLPASHGLIEADLTALREWLADLKRRD